MEVLLAFITGLTTGGLSCLAVQGGLLASSIAYDVEQSIATQPPQHGLKKKGNSKNARLQPTPVQPQMHAARPIALFLFAKIVAYTILGFLLGWVGSLLQLTATMRAILEFVIGVFMVGTALRMLNVHPIFRYFALQPPRAVTRYIRRKAKNAEGDVTPLFLGALTVLIPCGVTQAMMAVAMGTGSPVAGATIMFAFTLGTSPVFFAVAYAATRLGERLEGGFMKAVAIVVLVLGLVSIEAGLTLIGSPYSAHNLAHSLTGDGAQAVAAPADLQPAASAGGEQPGGQATGGGVQPLDKSALTGTLGGNGTSSGSMYRIAVGGNGYSPEITHAKGGQPIQLALVTNKTYSCARAFVIPSLGIEKILPETGTTVVEVPAQQPGSKLYYSCSMGMYSGVIQFDKG